VADPEDDGVDVVAFADFMRSTKAPPGARSPPTFWPAKRCLAKLGARFATHPRSPRRARGRKSTAVCSRSRRPLAIRSSILIDSDFLLHDIGTCDGIPVLPLPEYASTANQMRTAPLWALRTRNRLMHEGLSFTKQDAIQHHAGQAAGVTQNYNAVRGREKSIVSIPGFAVTEAVETGITELLQAKRNENPECQSPRLVMTPPPPDRATEKESCVVARRFARGAIIEALAQERKERQP
jgi:hypothetical protein